MAGNGGIGVVMTPRLSEVKWNAADYAANSAVQQTWARELIARLDLHGDEHVLDIGCGDGKVTAEIARALPRGTVVGTDASPQMIEFAQKAFPAKQFPNLEFQVMDARKIKPANFSSSSPSRKEERAGVRKPTFSNSKPFTPLEQGEGVALFDLIFSNAALHWVDDHQAILRGAASVLKTGGRLAVSCGGRGNAHDVFLALRPEIRLKRWCKFFRKMPKPYFFYAPEDYKKWLPKFGFKIRSVKLVPKDSVYTGVEGFVTWLRTTWIPYVQRLPENMREEFITAVARRYVAKHPPDAGDRVHVKMVRLEIDALKV
jgi:trans-aconitate methyltransferase